MSLSTLKPPVTAQSGTIEQIGCAVKRPEQHITDSKGDAILLAVFAEWSVNGSERDYGWDYVVEVFRNGESTGFLFNGQLKSSLHTVYSADGTFISQELELDSADYLARQLRQPTFLFHADVAAKRLFWSAIQLDQKVLEVLAKGKAKNLTVRIPTANSLPDKFDLFLQDLTQAQMVVVSRILLGTKPIEFVDAMASQPIERISEVAEDLHEKGFHLELQAAFLQRQGGDIAGAIDAINKVATGASAAGYIEIQFNAILQAGELEWLQMARSDVPQARVADKKLAMALELCRIAKRHPKRLHLFAEITRKAAELGVAVQKTFGLMMSWHAHRMRGDDPVWLAVLSFQLQQSLIVAHRKYHQSLRLAQATAKSRFRSVTSRPIAEIAVEIGKLARLLDSVGFKEAGLQYRQSAFGLLKFSAAIATENKSMDELFNAVMLARTLEQDTDGEIFKWAWSVIEQWPEDSPYRKNAEELMQRAVARKNGAKFDGDIETTPRQIHNNILTSAGFDPTTEPWASYIELAIKDDDPTRVLIDCQHKVVMKHPGGDPMLDRLALERANPKIIGCNLHRYALGGRELDNIDQEFRTRFCTPARTGSLVPRIGPSTMSHCELGRRRKGILRFESIAPGLAPINTPEFHYRASSPEDAVPRSTDHCQSARSSSRRLTPFSRANIRQYSR